MCNSLIDHITKYNRTLTVLAEIAAIPADKQSELISRLGENTVLDAGRMCKLGLIPYPNIDNESGLRALRSLDYRRFISTSKEVIIAYRDDKMDIMAILLELKSSEHQLLISRLKYEIQLCNDYLKDYIPRLESWVRSIPTNDSFSQLHEQYKELKAVRDQFERITCRTGIMIIEHLKKFNLSLDPLTVDMHHKYYQLTQE